MFASNRFKLQRDLLAYTRCNVKKFCIVSHGVIMYRRFVHFISKHRIMAVTTMRD